MESITNAQLASLDDTDCYASAWSEALQSSSTTGTDVKWGGRGKGGRGTARRTVQPYDIVVENVRLEYVHNNTEKVGLPGKVLLEDSILKLLSPRLYSLVGHNGCGKSTLLRRIAAGKIPGFPPHISTFYVPQEVMSGDNDEDDNNNANEDDSQTPLQYVLSHHEKFSQHANEALQSRMEQLEDELENLNLEEDATNDDSDDDDQKEELSPEERMELLCEAISALEDEKEDTHDARLIQDQARQALEFFSDPQDTKHNNTDGNSWYQHMPISQLSGGYKKKMMLACALFCKCDLLLLDEPTNYLDVYGLVQLRQLLQICFSRKTTVLMVSHDVDLNNDMATDTIHFSPQCSLEYYPGNYNAFLKYKHQQLTHLTKQSAALDKKRDLLLKSIDNVKKATAGKGRGGQRKKNRTIESRKKKLAKCGIEKDEKGHRWTAQKASTGMKEGSINSMDASTRNKNSSAQLLKSSDASIAPIPDKAVQFVFRDPTCTWGEPLIMAMDVGHSYDGNDRNDTDNDTKHLLFECVDICIDEGSTCCIMGANGSGKSTLLRLLAKEEEPMEGTIHHAHNLSVGYFDQHVADNLVVQHHSSSTTTTTALSFLSNHFPKKTEQELRGELNAFGLNTHQISTNVQFLSGGERCRLCLAFLMLQDPQLLIMDEPTSHLDVESVEALIYGLHQWKGTLILVSHDSHLVRELQGNGNNCYVLMPNEAKMRRIHGGIDAYLKAFK
mmetsp:Transcript_5065/g.7691  ORF Transcript_5065/g.7691 Transcript_5065/m.7691 type:complete len:727 (+) Transcript_5065:106-2286(+)